MTLARLSFVVAVVMSVAVVASAQQSLSADEKQIRDLIAAEDAGKAPPPTDDRIFWSGAYQRPFVGKEQGQERTGAGAPSNRVGQDRTTRTVRRIEVAKSGDLAYEFSDFQLSYTLKDGQKVSFPGSLLRVWRKEGGQWKVAGHFARPHDTGTAPAK